MAALHSWDVARDWENDAEMPDPGRGARTGSPRCLNESMTVGAADRELAAL